MRPKVTVSRSGLVVCYSVTLAATRETLQVALAVTLTRAGRRIVNSLVMTSEKEGCDFFCWVALVVHSDGINVESLGI